MLVQASTGSTTYSLVLNMILIPVCHVTVKEMGHKKYLGSLYKVCTVHVHVYVPTQTPGGYSGINMMGGGGGPTEPNILHSKKIHGPYIVHPKKYKTGNFLNHAFGSCWKFGLNCVRTISLAEIRTQKNTRRS